MKKLIDVSYHNEMIDWAKVKGNVDGVIIRCGYGDNLTSQDDKRFKEYAEACVRYGIPIGFYLYSYAKSMEQAKCCLAH